MTHWGFIIKFPDEFIWESFVIVLQDLCIKFLHPPNFDEEVGEVFISFLPDLFLDAVSEFVVAELGP